MKLAIMQPYFFPYIGYFQLINAVDKFVFYDDVNFIKNGWINRNRILINSQPSYFTVQLKNASPNKLINQVEFTDNRPKLIKQIQMAYKKAPHYEAAWPVIYECLTYETNYIRDLAVKSIVNVSKYLNINTVFETSSERYSETQGFEKTVRIINICNMNKAITYINVAAGLVIYQKEQFEKFGVDLLFLEPNMVKYKQYTSDFIPWLSVIDLIMFNPCEKVRSFLNNYEII